MNPVTRRSFCIGVFLVVLTLVVLYSYCNGNSVCYTFPFLSGLGHSRVIKPEAEMVVTSVIVKTKGPIGIQTIPTKQNQGHDVQKPAELNATRTHTKHGAKTESINNLTRGNAITPLTQDTSSLREHSLSHTGEKVNGTRVNENPLQKTPVLPPSDIVGKVAQKILQSANVSEEEANRELVRIEKVDKNVDRENGNQTKLQYQAEGVRRRKSSLIQKVKDARNTGAGKPEKRLVRVERVDLTDEDDEPEPEFEIKSKRNRDMHQSNSVIQDNLLSRESVSDSETASRTKNQINTTHAASKGAAGHREIKPLSLNIQKHITAKEKRDELGNSTKDNENMPPQFFLKFLNFTKDERKLVDSLVNYNNSNFTVHDNRSLNSWQQWNDTKLITKRRSTRTSVSSTRAHEGDARNKRDFGKSNETSGLPPLGVQLMNLAANERRTAIKEDSSSPKEQTSHEQLNGPFNLSRILRKIADGATEYQEKSSQTQVPDSAALLVKFLTHASGYLLRMPRNDTAKDRGSSDSRYNGSHDHEAELALSMNAPINLKKAIMGLSNHINFTDHENHSEQSTDGSENRLDLMLVLNALSRHNASHILGPFNLTKILKEIAGSSLKPSFTALQPIKGQPDKRHENREELHSTSKQSEVEIFGPAVDKLGTSKPLLVYNTERNPDAVFDSVEKLNKHHILPSSGSGYTKSESEDFERVDSEQRKSRNLPAMKISDRKQRSKPETNGILKFDKISCEALDPKILLYNRIFKTGSSTTESLIVNSSARLNYDYKIGTTEDWYDKGDSHPYPGLIIRKANKKLKKFPRMVFVAHFYFRRRLNLPQAHTYINQVRDPIRRVVSHYFYMRSSNRPSDRIRQFLKSNERNESLEQCFRLQHKGCQNNVMTRFFCGKHTYCRHGNGRALRTAVSNIKRYYAVVGLLESYDIYLEMLHRRLPNLFSRISKSVIGRAKYNPTYDFENVPKYLIELITKANWADVKLYSFIKERFWQQAKACGIGDDQEQIRPDLNN